MPAKVKIAEITVTETEVEVPDECPECKADLKDHGAIRESGYVAYFVYCHVDKGETQGEDENETDFSDSMVTRYECVGCSRVLAEG